MNKTRILLIFCLLLSSFAAVSAQVQYKLIATKKTSTAEKEINEAADAGFRFDGVSGGKTAFGGAEVVIIMSKPANADSRGRYRYKLLATSRTSTMQKELQQAGDNGFEYCGQTVYESAFGGDEVVVILEKDVDAKIRKFEYKLLATSKTSTMQKEISQAGDANFEFVGLTTGKTALGGNELVVILRREIVSR
ncbi:MAG: hypothetical protein JSS81_25420 [Acidobacteria bacterium]|nr:hypothetical protein [Acidobacteriota bacterium]